MGDTQHETPWAWVKRVRDLVDKPARFSVPLPVELLPWLLLSDEFGVRDNRLLKVLEVTHVLSVNGMAPFRRDEIASNLRAAGIEHKYSPGEDEEGYDMIGEHWEDSLEFLRAVHDGGGKVVVHCAAGMNRSAVIACAAHMVLERVPVLDVVENCVTRRGMVLCNRSFQKQLCELAASEGLLGPEPPGYNDDPIEDTMLTPPPSRVYTA